MMYHFFIDIFKEGSLISDPALPSIRALYIPKKNKIKKTNQNKTKQKSKKQTKTNKHKKKKKKETTQNKTKNKTNKQTTQQNTHTHIHDLKITNCTRLHSKW